MTDAIDIAVSRTTHVSALSLPPASAAAKYHNFCIYYQVQPWWNSTEQLNPKAQVKGIVKREMVPIQTDNEPAPSQGFSRPPAVPPTGWAIYCRNVSDLAWIEDLYLLAH